MKVLLQNAFITLRLSLTMLFVSGFWRKKGDDQKANVLSHLFTAFSFMFLCGIYIIVQAGELVQAFGDVPRMTSASFLLFTNMALATKMINILVRREKIKAILEESDDEIKLESREEGRRIIKRSDHDTAVLLYCYIFLSIVTVVGWAASAEKNKLPQEAWYPYDAYKSPSYELTYAHQTVAVYIAAVVNMSLDTVVTSLVAQCCCRMRLLGLSLRTLCQDVDVLDGQMLNQEQEEIVKSRLHHSIRRHRSVLHAVTQIQDCFSEPILVQFTVSMVIICVTAYTLAFETKNMVRLISMSAYLLCMMLQVFLYCYQGNQVSIESIVVAEAAYKSPWYCYSPGLRRELLLLMTRTSRVARLTAAGITTLSLSAFTSIIKASYTFFTVLQQVEDRNKSN